MVDVKQKRRQMDQIASDQFYIPLEDLAINQGLFFLVNKILKNLKPKHLAKCRLVSKILKDHIDNNKQWQIFKLKYMSSKSTTFVDYTGNIVGLYGSWQSHSQKRLVRGLIRKIFPEWKVVEKYFINVKSTERLRSFVSYMWSYFHDVQKAYVNPLHFAVCEGQIDFVKLLIDSPLDFNVPTQKRNTVVALACMKNQIEILGLLIDKAKKKNINFETREAFGQTPFHHAYKSGSLDLVKLLLNYLQFESIDFLPLTRSGCDIFHLSVINPDTRVPQYIFEQFNDKFNDKNTYLGSKVIHLAIRKGQNETINYLLKSRKLFNIDISAKNERNQNILHLISYYNRINVFEFVVKCLKEDSCEIDVNEFDDNGFTPLHYTCRYGTIETLLLLLSLKPDMNAITKGEENNYFYEVTKGGENIFHLAACNSNSDIMQYLLTNYSTVVEQTTDLFGRTTLHFACQQGFLEHVKLLFEYPAIKTFDSQNNKGNTPLHLASQYGHYKIVKYILSKSKYKSIDINKVNNAGHTAEFSAKIEQHEKVIEIFKTFHSVMQIMLRVKRKKKSRELNNCQRFIKE